MPRVSRVQIASNKRTVHAGAHNTGERKRRRVVEDTEESEDVRTSDDMDSPGDDTEGSLADFIEHDSAEAEQTDASYTASSDDESLSAAGDAEPEQCSETDDDPDECIKRQYSNNMEHACGSVITPAGVRRSMRANKGKAPTRYVDEDYAELMLEDMTAQERAALREEFTTDDDNDTDGSIVSSADAKDGEGEDEDENDESDS
jgi:hypothetical protein